MLVLGFVIFAVGIMGALLFSRATSLKDPKWRDVLICAGAAVLSAFVLLGAINLLLQHASHPSPTLRGRTS